MPLMQLEELELISGVFRGRSGNAFARELMRVLSIDRINELYDRFPDKQHWNGEPVFMSEYGGIRVVLQDVNAENTKEALATVLDMIKGMKEYLKKQEEDL